jgi:D-glycero-D-manno-heptose 1,7-bisphosphate phosphatase
MKKRGERPVFDASWTLFLDRDGVINEKIDNDYVRSWERFTFLPGVLTALQELSGIFGRIVVTTNQRGIGRGLFTEADLQDIHHRMLEEVVAAGGRIDACYFCPHLQDAPDCNCRKPLPGMALQAKAQFPEIVFSKSVLVGDSVSDIQFGKNLGMHTVHITKSDVTMSDEKYASLFNWCSSIIQP